MAKKTQDVAPGEQMDLIDVHGEQVKKLIAPARAYRATITKRLKIQETEANQKAALTDLVKAANLKPIIENRKKIVRFKYEDVTIEYTHEEKDNVKVTIDND